MEHQTTQKTAGEAPLPSLAGSAGWDIRLQCTVCGFRVRRHRNDYPGFLGRNPKATIEIQCDNCNAEADYPKGGVKTLHFIDFASDREMATCE